MTCRPLFFLLWLGLLTTLPACSMIITRSEIVTAEPLTQPVIVEETTVAPEESPAALTPAAGDGAPLADADPFAVAREIVEQTALAERGGWRVVPCEGDGAYFCIDEGGQTIGYAELLLFPLSGYPVDHPLQRALPHLPVSGAPYSAEQAAEARVALAALAGDYLQSTASDRAATSADGTFSPLTPEPAALGELPGLTFGFVHTRPGGEVVERYHVVAAFDQHFVYWLIAAFDPAHTSTFDSDDAFTRFAPLFRELAAALAVPHSS
ncbi:MAG: hypothetical protein R3272_09270 [Candidatus Promineifilaceae bacterium]|nr:hypothetical protein [Candidatus Promineifilaceae bacterium]